MLVHVLSMFIQEVRDSKHFGGVLRYDGRLIKVL